MAKRLSGTAGIVDMLGLRPLDETAIAWARDVRKISRSTLEVLRVESGTAFVPKLKCKADIIAFRVPGGWKGRSYPEKGFVAHEGSKRCFWGLKDVLDGNDMREVYIVEGEMDRCAMVEAGFTPDQVLASPGASGDDEEALTYVVDALKAGLHKAGKFILCMDCDEPGLALRQAMANVLGKARCRFVDWPDGIGDANAMLVASGSKVLHDFIIEEQKLWPTDGAFRFREIPMPPPLERWATGFEDWDHCLWLASNTLSVVTGHPGHGKTQLFAQIWFQILRANPQLQMIVATFETRARPHYERIIKRLHVGGILDRRIVSAEQLQAAEDFLHDRYVFLIHPEGRPNLRWVLDQAELLVKRDGARILQIDPWNRLESHRLERQSETDYIGGCLRELYQFKDDMQCHVQMLAHPAKSDYGMFGKMPVLESIAGSKHWENMTDQGFCVWRPKLYDDDGVPQTYAELHHLKARFEELGQPRPFGLEYDVPNGVYRTRKLDRPQKKKSKGED